MIPFMRIEAFVYVAKEHSFAGAAKKLGCTTSAVSKHVSQLEDHLGVRLLQRTTRHISLTEEGAIFLERARQMLDDWFDAEESVQSLKAEPRGVLKVNAPMSFGVSHLAEPITDFARKYSQIELYIDFDDRHIDMIAEGYDVVIRIASLQDSSLIARKLADCSIKLYASPYYLKNFGTPNLIDDLNDHRFIEYSKHGGSSDWHYSNKNGDTGSFAIKGQMKANSAEMMVAAAKGGLGIALLPDFAVINALEKGELVPVLDDYQANPLRGIYAMYPERRYLSTKVKLFVDHLSDVIKS